MGKQDGAVSGTLCVVDLDAGACNGSTPRNISVYKWLVHVETAVFTCFKCIGARGREHL